MQSGRSLRMRGRGLPELNASRTGDQMVRIHVWTPQNLSARDRELLEQLRESDAFVPRPDDERNQKSFFSRVKDVFTRSEEHTSELQSRGPLVCRLLLENRNTN